MDSGPCRICSAEMGGVLLDAIEQGARAIVQVEDLSSVPVRIQARALFSFDQRRRSGLQRRARRANSPNNIAAYLRSQLFSQPPAGRIIAGAGRRRFARPLFSIAFALIALLVKPYATKVSLASFSSATTAFPFHRAARIPIPPPRIDGVRAPPRRSMLERIPLRRDRAAELRAIPQEEEIEDTAPCASRAGVRLRLSIEIACPRRMGMDSIVIRLLVAGRGAQVPSPP